MLCQAHHVAGTAQNIGVGDRGSCCELRISDQVFMNALLHRVETVAQHEA
jgi:hypothetical protein